MKRTRWGRLLATAVTVAGLASGVAWADEASEAKAPVVVLREPGKPDRNCIVDKATPQADGSTLYEVRDAATGERLRVLDKRKNKSSAGTVQAKVSGPSSVDVAAGAPASTTPAVKSERSAVKVEEPMNSLPAPGLALGARLKKAAAKIATTEEPARADAPTVGTKPPADAHVPTTAELASSSKSPIHRPGHLLPRKKAQPVIEKTEESPLQAQLTKLKEALGPSEREMVAMALTVGEHHANPEVVAALMQAAKSDPAASVRCCLARCLFRLSSESPQVIPVLKDMQADTSDEVRTVADQALAELAKTSAKVEKH